jgi:rhodanese-related sulfurtransferase
MQLLPEPDQSVESPANRAVLEISLASSLELRQLGLATIFDIRQAFELEVKGRVPETVHVPLFEVKRILGETLTSDEQEVLDAGAPTEFDALSFIKLVNQAHHGRDHILLCLCNSGRRSLYAAQMLRELGYPKALSVAGGFQAWKKLQAAAPVVSAAAPAAPAAQAAPATPATTTAPASAP